MVGRIARRGEMCGRVAKLAMERRSRHGSSRGRNGSAAEGELWGIDDVGACCGSI